MESIKREYPRRQKKIKAMISLHLDDNNLNDISTHSTQKKIRIMSHTKDIGWGGICLEFEDLPKDSGNSFSPSRAHTIVGKSIQIKLRDPNLTLWGEVIRFDSKTREMAILITKVSDYNYWQTICDEKVSV